MPVIRTNGGNRTKLFEGLIIPNPPNEELSPIMQGYLRSLNDYILRLGQKIGQLVGSGENSDDRLVTVSDDDTTPNTLIEKIISSDNSVDISEVNEGGDEQLDLKVGAGALDVDRRYRVTGNSSAHLINASDWRGRLVVAYCAQITGDLTTAEGTIWTASDIVQIMVGSNAAEGDYALLFTAASGGNIQFYIESGTGRLMVNFTDFVSEYQIRVRVFASVFKDVEDETI
jgi:hypothetical protein